ncbi:MAG: hypothetical protein WAL09_09315 [Pseudolabrys sp.]
MLAAWNDRAFAAGINADDAAVACCGIFFRSSVTLDADEAEIYFADDAAGIFECQRKVTINAGSNIAPFRLYANGFSDGQLAILGETNVGVE